MSLLFNSISQYSSDLYEVARGLLRSRNRQAQRSASQTQVICELRWENDQLAKRLHTAEKILDQTQQLLRQEHQENSNLRPQPVTLSIDLPLPHHTFGPKMISLCLNLSNRLGFRPTETALRVIFDWLGIEARLPSHDSIRCWSLRAGIAKLQQPVEAADDWIWMADHSNQIGTEKVLQILGIRIEPQALKKHGFDDWAMWTGYETGNPPSENRYQDPYINTPDEGSRTYEGKFGPDIYTDRLINFMRDHKDEPMCLYYPIPLLHRPFVATPDEPNAKSRLDKHKAMVRYVDKMVGRLVSELDELGIRQRTIVIFTSDNGTDKLITGKRNGRIVKGAKGTESEDGVCAPFIVNGPGLVPAGVETDALTDFTDMLPTFVELGGGKVPEDLVIDGTSIAPLILGKKQDTDREWIMSLGFSSARLDSKGVRGRKNFAPRGIRDKRYKVWVSDAKKIIRLHDLQEDPREEMNLLKSKIAEHKTALLKFQAVVDSLPDKDARPLYEPRAANPWDKKVGKAK